MDCKGRSNFGHWWRGRLLGMDFFKREKMQESLSFAGEVQTHAVSLLAVWEAAVCAVRQRHGKLWVMCLWFCAGQQIGVDLAKELRISLPPPFIYICRFYLASVCWEVEKTRTTEHKQREARPVPQQNWPEYCRFLTLKGGCCHKQWREGHPWGQNIKYKIYFLDRSTQDFLEKLLTTLKLQLVDLE